MWDGRKRGNCSDSNLRVGSWVWGTAENDRVTWVCPVGHNAPAWCHHVLRGLPWADLHTKAACECLRKICVSGARARCKPVCSSATTASATDASVLDTSELGSRCSRRQIKRPLEYPPLHPLEYRVRYSIKGHVFEGLGAFAPVGAGADESASLRLIKTGRLPICKRPPLFQQVNHIEWLIRT